MPDTLRASRNPLKRLFARKKDRKSNPDPASQVDPSASALPSVNTSPRFTIDDGVSTNSDTTLLPAGSATNSPRVSATILPAAEPNDGLKSQGLDASATRSDPTQPLDFWALAFTPLPPKDQELLQKYLPTRDSGSSQLFADIVKAACEKRDAVDARKWTVHVMGRKVSVRSQADLVIRWLDRFKSVGDMAVSADPIMAGLPWAAVQFLIQVRVDCFFEYTRYKHVPGTYGVPCPRRGKR